MDEFDLIRTHFARWATSPGAAGLQDDVAEIARLENGERLVVTCDAIVEGVHFLPDDPIATVARKLVRVNVSDILAKGGKPDAAFLALVWPRNRDQSEIADFARALGADLQKWGAHLAGGDTTATDGPLALTLTLTGRTGKRGPVRRAGAIPGDDIWVTGTIGDGWLGLQAAKGAFPHLIAEGRAALIAPYHTPAIQPLAAADVVAANASASIDVSDGLIADAMHVAEASRVRLVIEADKVPLSAIARNYLDNARVELLSLLTGGDDYQILFTAASERSADIRASKTPATLIGRAEEGSGVRLLDGSGCEIPVGSGGWAHFRP